MRGIRGEEIEKLDKFCKETVRKLQHTKDKLKVASETIAYYRECANLNTSFEAQGKTNFKQKTCQARAQADI